MSTTAPFRGAARAAAYVEEDTARRRPADPAPPVEPSDAALDEVDEVDTASGSIEEIDVASLTATDTSPIARTGVRGLIARTGVKLAPGRSELAALARAARLKADEDVIRQTTWPRAVGILVANRKGGVGKTPTSLILGGILASIRGGSVAVMEVSDDPGTLTYRTEGNPTRGIGELVVDHDQIRSAGQLASYTAPQTSFASVIGTTGVRPQLVATDVLHAAAVVDEFYAIRVMDSGNQPSSSAFDGALAATDALVIPVLNSAEAVLEAISSWTTSAPVVPRTVGSRTPRPSCG
ncbi:hypothetical protein GCM10025881_15640 [Pseudolysinimonas kribbensis]|uniref:ParA family protein n=1 Tax=Pseudolysinimonas kribbensis TaxID=433641 RepID=A0ABQ6K291_9MICO|nr:hypothetical protein [Pseudolysinimonas kribbensis]GMA94740.1 hypothetical protein GCM10025881_15640 [Pseudolysinimonas kribbensis]